MTVAVPGRPGPGGRRVDWLLDDFARSTPGVRLVLVVSGDGLRLATSARVETGLADGLSAAVSGLVSLARGIAGLLEAGPVVQSVVEMADGCLFASGVSHRSVLVVHADRDCDLGIVTHEMSLLGARVGHALTPVPRTSVEPALKLAR